jgi:hypothetical protein
VAARRLLILMLVLLGVSTVAAALVPVDRTVDDETTTTTTSTREAPTGELVPESIDAGADTPTTIRVQVGDQLQLRVTSPEPDEVEIPALDELEDVDPEAPARFDLLLFNRGQFPVRLVEAERKIGEIVVDNPKGGPKSKG